MSKPTPISRTRGRRSTRADGDATANMAARAGKGPRPRRATRTVPATRRPEVPGYALAKKEQVGELVRVLLGLSAIPRPDDAADAAAIAICHLHTSHLDVLA